MATTIQISKELLESLKKRKIHSKESYEEIIWDLLEDTMELSEETKRNIEESRAQYERGEVVSFEEIKKRMNNV
jgi:predicted transcriptional regulator